MHSFSPKEIKHSRMRPTKYKTLNSFLTHFFCRQLGINIINTTQITSTKVNWRQKLLQKYFLNESSFFFYFAANILDLTLTLGILYWQLNCLLEIWYLTKFCWSRNFPKNSIFVNVCFERICSRLHFRKRSAYVYKYSGIYWLSIVSLNQLKELTLIRTLIF